MARAAELAIKEAGGLGSPVHVEIDSDIPAASGLGSSAAVAVAFVAALLSLLGLKPRLDVVNRLAYEAERIVHGNPSGIDNTVASIGGTIVFRRGVGVLNSLSNTPLSKDDAVLLLVHTGVERQTGAAVSRALGIRRALGRLADRVVSLVDDMVDEAVDRLRRGDLEGFGALMRFNHGLLNAINVSIPVAETIVHQLERRPGVYGVKLTGAGLGGFIVALVDAEHAPHLLDELSKLKLKTLHVRGEEPGVRVEECTQPGRS